MGFVFVSDGSGLVPEPLVTDPDPGADPDPDPDPDIVYSDNELVVYSQFVSDKYLIKSKKNEIQREITLPLFIMKKLFSHVTQKKGYIHLTILVKTHLFFVLAKKFWIFLLISAFNLKNTSGVNW